MKACTSRLLLFFLAVAIGPAAASGVAHAVDNSNRQDARTRSERFRPQYHFSMKTGWINDPNGLVHHDGVYHLFSQHYPDATRWGPMHWSHATSADLVHWKERPIALHPDKRGTCWSGSAVVDWKNTSGLGRDGKAPLLAFYTAAGSDAKPPAPFTQCLAYSTDNGKTWDKYQGNPVLGHIHGGNRDPKVFWHEPTQRWIMILYLDIEDTFGLFASPDAIRWEELSRFKVPDSRECPDLFEMPVVGNREQRKWVFLSGSGWHVRGDCARYMIGDFDGKVFKPESKPIPIEWGGWNYSTQTFSDAPGNRRILVSWFSTHPDGSSAFPGNPFNGQYRVPWELKLVGTSQGLRLARLPVRELNQLRGAALSLPTGELAAGDHPIAALDSRSVDIECDIKPGDAGSIGFSFEGVSVVAYDAAAKTMRVSDRRHAWPLEPDGTLKLRILFDVNCVEVFGPRGLKVMSAIYLPKTLKELDESKPKLSLHVQGGPVRLDHLAVYPMRSIWNGSEE